MACGADVIATRNHRDYAGAPIRAQRRLRLSKIDDPARNAEPIRPLHPAWRLLVEPGLLEAAAVVDDLVRDQVLHVG